MTATPKSSQSPIEGAESPLSETSRATPKTAIVVATKKDRGNHFLEASDSKIGVKIIDRLTIKPTFVAEVRVTPEVSR